MPPSILSKENPRPNMMKCTSIIVILSILVNATSADVMLRMLFNNGVVEEGQSCTADDDMLISKVFDRPLNRRNLRSSELTYVDRPIDSFHEIIPAVRDLYVVGSPGYCKEECRGWAAGECRATSCGWYNKKRRLQHYGKGFLSNSTLCRTTADSINSDLNLLVSDNMVSSTCIALLNAPRKIECYEEVMNGIIEGFTVIAADTDSILIPFLHARKTICGLSPLNFEVKVNPCVETVTMKLVNKMAGYATTVTLDTTVPGPYTIFGMNGKNDYEGVHLPMGNFTLDATPDGNFNKTRSRNFYLEAC